MVCICAVEGVQPPAAPESALETVLNMVLRLPPMAVRAPMAATETKAAMRPYSMAVAPSSFLTNAIIFVNIVLTPLRFLVVMPTHLRKKTLIVD